MTERNCSLCRLMDIIDSIMENLDSCPECGEYSLLAKWSGVECVNPHCSYWKCL